MAEHDHKVADSGYVFPSERAERLREAAATMRLASAITTALSLKFEKDEREARERRGI